MIQPVPLITPVIVRPCPCNGICLCHAEPMPRAFRAIGGLVMLALAGLLLFLAYNMMIKGALGVLENGNFNGEPQPTDWAAFLVICIPTSVLGLWGALLLASTSGNQEVNQ